MVRFGSVLSAMKADTPTCQFFPVMPRCTLVLRDGGIEPTPPVVVDRNLSDRLPLVTWHTPVPGWLASVDRGVGPGWPGIFKLLDRRSCRRRPLFYARNSCPDRTCRPFEFCLVAPREGAPAHEVA